MSVATKLNLKAGNREHVEHAPPDVDLELQDMLSEEDATAADAVIVFATNRVELEQPRDPAIEAGKRDAIAWIAYPKAKQLGTDLNRDLLAQALQGTGVRPVRQVAINDVWSALRFRPE